MLILSLCPYVVEASRGALWGSLLLKKKKALIPFMKALPSQPYHLPKAFTSWIPSHWELGSHANSGGTYSSYSIVFLNGCTTWLSHQQYMKVSVLHTQQCLVLSVFWISCVFKLLKAVGVGASWRIYIVFLADLVCWLLEASFELVYVQTSGIFSQCWKLLGIVNFDLQFYRPEYQLFICH